jgi:hypothetical protein
METHMGTSSDQTEGSIHDYPLLDALRDRRSRRFGRGMKIPSGPLAFESVIRPGP